MASAPTVDTSLYSLSSEQAEFFKAQTDIDDDEDLKRHILEVQVKAYKASHSQWTLNITFLRLSLSHLPVYEHILELGCKCPDAVLLDIGYCLGTDARKAVADGFPAKNIIASDLFNGNMVSIF
ncbi:hypothetical protein C8R48DRAFT_608723 [Suillus tomentosus]|nr:hypothetical protein C8R48DRAFT_608723 [Suillus tomentosus]